jgi:ribonuclease HI
MEVDSVLRFIQGVYDILIVELYAIYKGLLLAKDVEIDEIICYSDSLPCINIINGPQVNYHIHIMLIKDIKKLQSQNNISLYYILRKKNQFAHFFILNLLKY